MKEIWKTIENYEGLYEVSTLGRVKSFKLGKEAILNPSKNSKGYLVINLHKDGKRKTFNLHKLVAVAFLSHSPCGMRLVVDHINNDKQDNRAENLQLISNQENTSKDRKKWIQSNKYFGISCNAKTKKWKAEILLNGKLHYIGLYKSEIEANEAYLKKLP
jgi:hypothetical protein